MATCPWNRFPASIHSWVHWAAGGSGRTWDWGGLRQRYLKLTEVRRRESLGDRGLEWAEGAEEGFRRFRFEAWVLLPSLGRRYRPIERPRNELIFVSLESPEQVELVGATRAIIASACRGREGQPHTPIPLASLQASAIPAESFVVGVHWAVATSIEPRLLTP
jgi:hypothetical protein